MSEPTKRFSDRVEYYARHRPRYPAALLQFFQQGLGLQPSHVIADVGSGTGFLAELFLKNGNPVIGVEPNQEMREAGERLLEGYPWFRSVDGTAEATTLEPASVDLVTAGQAFHWFQPEAARQEFARILKPGGRVALVWNERAEDNTPFTRAYEQIQEAYSTEYRAVSDRRLASTDRGVLDSFFRPGGYRTATFPNEQWFDFEGLCGRVLSSSYAPLPGHPNHEPMLAALRDLFDRFNTNGQVRLGYETQLYYGRVG